MRDVAYTCVIGWSVIVIMIVSTWDERAAKNCKERWEGLLPYAYLADGGDCRVQIRGQWWPEDVVEVTP